jgi:hypothetical protein
LSFLIVLFHVYFTFPFRIITDVSARPLSERQKEIPRLKWAVFMIRTNNRRRNLERKRLAIDPCKRFPPPLEMITPVPIPEITFRAAEVVPPIVFPDGRNNAMPVVFPSR